MNALESRFGSALWWLVAFAVLAAVIGWETGWGRRVTTAPDPAPGPAAPAVELALLPEYQLEGGVAARRETVERPAFVPTRRPAPAPVQEAARPRMQRGQFLLTGTAVVDQKSIAFLREAAGGKARTVRAGETINGLVVSEVTKDRVKLTLGDESEELVLRVAGGPRTTVQPPVVGGPSVVTPGPAGRAVPGAVPGTPGAPVATSAPAQPPGTGQVDSQAYNDAEQSVLERRRAARAAQAQAEAAARAAQSPAAPGQTPQPAVPLPSAATPSQPDPAWAEVYRRMQQPRR